MGALGSAWPTLRADMTLITDDWLQSCLLQIIPHMFLPTIRTYHILDFTSAHSHCFFSFFERGAVWAINHNKSYTFKCDGWLVAVASNYRRSPICYFGVQKQSAEGVYTTYYTIVLCTCGCSEWLQAVCNQVRTGGRVLIPQIASSLLLPSTGQFLDLFSCLAFL